MGGLLHLLQRGGLGGDACSSPMPLLAVPNVAVHPSTAPSTASVPTSYYLMWHALQLPLDSKGLTRDELWLITGVYSIWGFVRPNNWFGHQTCAILNYKIEYKMDDDNCGKTNYGYICDIRASSASSSLRRYDTVYLLCTNCYF